MYVKKQLTLWQKAFLPSVASRTLIFAIIIFGLSIFSLEIFNIPTCIMEWFRQELSFWRYLSDGQKSISLQSRHLIYLILARQSICMSCVYVICISKCFFFRPEICRTGPKSYLDYTPIQG